MLVKLFTGNSTRFENVLGVYLDNEEIRQYLAKL